jgi:hypothetical protein
MTKEIKNKNEFFTWSSFGTLSGASSSVLLICSVIYSVFEYNPKWLALFISIAISIIIFMSGKKNIIDIKHSFLAFINGLLIYATTIGLNTVISNIPTKTTTTESMYPKSTIEMKIESQDKPTFFLLKSWFK